MIAGLSIQSPDSVAIYRTPFPGQYSVFVLASGMVFGLNHHALKPAGLTGMSGMATKLAFRVNQNRRVA
jgi:hypothetical protein